MYEKYLKLLEEKGVRNSEVSKATGIPQSTFSDWKKGRSVPKMEKLVKLADYFGVNVSYFTGEENDRSETAYYLNPETARIAQEIFENSEMRALFDAASDIAPENLQLVYQMVLALKKKENGEDL